MANLNRCDFIGRCGKDPELRYTPNGTPCANVSIAVDESYKGKDGNKQEKTEWVSLVFWGKLAEIVGEYVTKGMEIYVSGRMQTRKWQDKDGDDRWTTEIVGDKMQMLSGKGEKKDNSNPKPFDDPTFNPDDDIPF